MAVSCCRLLSASKINPHLFYAHYASKNAKWAHKIKIQGYPDGAGCWLRRIQPVHQKDGINPWLRLA
jgi:hypothetical protein